MNKSLHYISTDISKQLYLFERIKQIFFQRGEKKTCLHYRESTVYTFWYVKA